MLLLPYPNTDTEVCQSNQEHDHVDDQKRILRALQPPAQGVFKFVISRPLIGQNKPIRHSHWMKYVETELQYL